MADQVEVVFSHPHREHEVGDRVSVDASEAQHLVTAGVAVFATKRDARAVGAEDAPTASTRGK